METAENKYITVAYKLYTIEDGEKELVEEAKAEHPFQFISGMGTTLEAFESQIVPLKKGDKFDFTIPNSARLAIYGRRNFPPTIAQFDFYQVYDGSTIKEPESQTFRNRVSIQPLYLDI